HGQGARRQGPPGRQLPELRRRHRAPARNRAGVAPAKEGRRRERLPAFPLPPRRRSLLIGRPPRGDGIRPESRPQPRDQRPRRTPRPPPPRRRSHRRGKEKEIAWKVTSGK